MIAEANTPGPSSEQAGDAPPENTGVDKPRVEWTKAESGWLFVNVQPGGAVTDFGVGKSDGRIALILADGVNVLAEFHMPPHLAKSVVEKLQEAISVPQPA